MEKAIFNKRGTRQIIQSGWKEFDKQTTLITTGNAILTTQHSSYVRPWTQCQCNGYLFPEGALTRGDISTFGNIPLSIKEILFDKNRRDSVILYEFWTYRNGRPQTFCWVVTDHNNKLITKKVVVYYGTRADKRIMAMDCILKYITE